jgi:hypothetical protein
MLRDYGFVFEKQLTKMILVFCVTILYLRNNDRKIIVRSFANIAHDWINSDEMTEKATLTQFETATSLSMIRSFFVKGFGEKSLFLNFGGYYLTKGN